jgi:hypothetical protein
MAATKLALNQCKSIQSPKICASLNKVGIHRNVARAIVFRPKSLGGLEMHHIYTLQGKKCLQYFLGHITCNDGNGNPVKICMEPTQLEVQTYEPFLFLKKSYAGKSLINQSRLTEIWSHLDLCKETITTADPWLPKPQIEHDVALVFMAFEANLSTAQQRQMNAYRIFICVISP